jgi:transcriptional regulator with XRE-family HTH domain
MQPIIQRWNRSRSSYTVPVQTVGQLIRDARTQLGLSLRALAPHLGVTPAFLNHVEHGRSPLPERLVPPLAQALHLDPTRLREAAFLTRAPESLRQKLAPAPRFPRLREAVLAHAQDPDRLREALAATTVHPVEVTILNIFTAILDEWLLNELPLACGSTWRRYVAMGVLTAVYRAGSPAEFALAFRSPDVWEEAILELLTTHRPLAPLGYPDRVQTASRLREYVIGAPLRWHGFERTVEEVLRRAAAPEAVIWDVRRAAPAWATAPVLSAPHRRFQPRVDALWEHRRRYVTQVGLAHPGGALGAAVDLFQDPAFEVSALFENLPYTSMWLAEVGYDPETATVVLNPTWGTTPQPLGFAPEPMLGLQFLAARRRLFEDGMGLGPPPSRPRHRPTPRQREHVRARA